MKTSEQENLDGFSLICKLDELKEHSGKRFYVNDVDIAVFKIAGNVYALNNVCPHQHTAMIYDGFIEHGCVVCPAHGWMFDLQTGRMPNGSKGLDAYETKVIQDKVYVKVVKKELKW